MFIWIDNRKYITIAINKRFIRLFFYLDNTDDIINDMNTENDFDRTTFCEFSLIYLVIFWI